MEIAYVWVLMSVEHGSYDLKSVYRDQETAFRVGNGFERPSYGQPITHGWTQRDETSWHREVRPTFSYVIVRKPLIADWEV